MDLRDVEGSREFAVPGNWLKIDGGLHIPIAPWVVAANEPAARVSTDTDGAVVASFQVPGDLAALRGYYKEFAQGEAWAIDADRGDDAIWLLSLRKGTVRIGLWVVTAPGSMPILTIAIKNIEGVEKFATLELS